LDGVEEQEEKQDTPNDLTGPVETVNGKIQIKTGSLQQAVLDKDQESVRRRNTMDKQKEPGIPDGPIANGIVLHSRADIGIAILEKGRKRIKMLKNEKLQQGSSDSDQPFTGHAIKIAKKARGQPVKKITWPTSLA